MTICRQCKHLIEESSIWHGQFCRASESPKHLNFVTGEKEYQYGNKYQFASYVNKDGNCPLFDKLTAMDKVSNVFTTKEA